MPPKKIIRVLLEEFAKAVQINFGVYYFLAKLVIYGCEMKAVLLLLSLSVRFSAIADNAVFSE
jgi:hypothetical protein